MNTSYTVNLTPPEKPARIEEKTRRQAVLPNGRILLFLRGQHFRVDLQKLRAIGELLEDACERVDGVDDNRAVENVFRYRFLHFTRNPEKGPS